MTLQLGPIQTTRMNFSRVDSLSFAYCTRTYAYDARPSSSCSRSSVRPPDPVDVSTSLSERSDYRSECGHRCTGEASTGAVGYRRWAGFTTSGGRCGVSAGGRGGRAGRVSTVVRAGKAHSGVRGRYTPHSRSAASWCPTCPNGRPGTLYGGGACAVSERECMGRCTRTFVDLRIGDVGHVVRASR